MADLPPLPGEITMDELMALAGRLMDHPENRPGSDKTWVLERMRKFQALIRDVKAGSFTRRDPPDDLDQR